jgi:hypothetical protein
MWIIVLGVELMIFEIISASCGHGQTSSRASCDCYILHHGDLYNGGCFCFLAGYWCHGCNYHAYPGCTYNAIINCGTSADCLACSIGTYVPGASAACSPCAPGSYQDQSTQSACEPCLAGTANSNSGKNCVNRLW